MGVKFSKELNLAREQIYPLNNQKMEMTAMQEKLVKKLGATAHPFFFQFPPNSPSSVVLQAQDSEEGKPLGVSYTVQCYVASSIDDAQHNRNMVTLAIKKLQYAPASRGKRLPSSLVSKGFTFSQGKINLEVTLDREIYYHGEKVSATVVVTNNSKKTVKNIKVFVIQHTEVTMINSQFSKQIASLETREGCPITPGANFTKAFFLVPVASSNKDRRGMYKKK
jgi:arrestin-2